MSKLEELMVELCPEEVAYKTLGEIATDVFRGAGITRDQVRETGTPCVRYGEIYTTYGVWFEDCVSHTDETLLTNKKYFGYGDILFAITGESVEDIAKCCAYIGHETCLAGGDVVVLKHNENPKYLSYALSTLDAQKQKSKGKVKSKVVHSSVPDIKAIRIPVPPLPVQREIVRILDNFTELTAKLTENLSRELTKRKQQYQYYRDKLLTFAAQGEGYASIELGSIGKISMCKRIMKAETSSDGDVPFYKIGTFGKKPDAYISREKFEEYRKAYPFPKRGDVLISAAGTIGRTVIYDGEDAYYQDSNIVWIDNDESVVLNRYLFYCYQLQPWAVSEGGTIARLYNDNISRTKIRVPSMEKQKRIIAILDCFDALCTNLSSGLTSEIEARQKQYEYYRNKLLSFREMSVNEQA